MGCAAGDAVSLKGMDAAGYWSLGGSRIVLTECIVDDGSAVRHEMLHAILQVGGHPRAQFLGACAALVDCEGSCITVGAARGTRHGKTT